MVVNVPTNVYFFSLQTFVLSRQKLRDQLFNDRLSGRVCVWHRLANGVISTWTESMD